MLVVAASLRGQNTPTQRGCWLLLLVTEESFQAACSGHKDPEVLWIVKEEVPVMQRRLHSDVSTYDPEKEFLLWAQTATTDYVARVPRHCNIYYNDWPLKGMRTTHVTNTNAFRACANCKKAESLQQCSRCKCVFYCSKDCQKKHWHKHKTICG